MKQKILVTGAKGQLGNELQVLSKKFSQYEYFFHDIDTLPLENSDVLEKFFVEHKLDFCVNAAAYTAVDKAEQEKEISFLVNAKAVGDLAKICNKYNVKLLHVSTDYVFDGKATSPYNEESKTNPLNVYGKSKLEGEILCQQNNPSAIIIRTAWVYSSFGNNFVKTIMRLLRERQTLKVVNDQIGSPTYAANLAEAILTIINSRKWQSGIYHYTNKGNISWFEFAKGIKDLIAPTTCELIPCSTAEYPTPAYRSPYTVLDCEKINQTYNVELYDWKPQLKSCIEKLMETQK